MAGDHIYVLVTGANSGLGFGICCRLVDDFLASRPTSAQLTVIFSTRSSRKGSETLKLLQSHLSRHRQHASESNRVHFRSVSVDLTRLLTVRTLAKALNESDIPRLDAVILNAGMIGIAGINWPVAVWSIVSDLIHAFTWPTFKIAAVGLITQPQLQGSDGKSVPEPPLGEVFCANVFGHYMLTHWLMPVLRACPPESPGKVIWISSIECKASHFNPEDLQGIRSATAYEHSKRLTDLMALTSHSQPATAKAVEGFCSTSTSTSTQPHNPSDPQAPTSKPTIHIAHPGICVTAIVPLYWIMLQLFTLSAWVTRLVGSPWATISPSTGACSAVWLALSPTEEIQRKSQPQTNSTSPNSKDSPATSPSPIHTINPLPVINSSSVKWGSAISRLGRARAEKTDVEGWGLDGSGLPFLESWWARDMFGSWGRMRGSHEATREDVEVFVDTGARVWREMEALRVEWEGRIEEWETMQGK